MATYWSINKMCIEACVLFRNLWLSELVKCIFHMQETNYLKKEDNCLNKMM